jgi:hypothetical protein
MPKSCSRVLTKRWTSPRRPGAFCRPAGSICSPTLALSRLSIRPLTLFVTIIMNMVVTVVRGIRCVALLLAGVVAAGIGGCTSNSQSGRRQDVEPQTATDRAGLTATVQRSTLFETRRSLRLTMRSNAGEEREIGAIQLESPLFQPVEPQARNARVPPAGRPVVMGLPFGTVRCDGRNGGGDAAEEDGAAVLLADVDGHDVRVPIEQRPNDLLVELHGAECAAAAVLADVDLRLGDTWRSTDPRTLEGELDISQRRDGAEATVEAVDGNVIFTVSDATASPGALEVSDERPSASAPIAITASRCDPHALIEYKRTFIFTASIRVNSDEPARVDIRAEGAARRALEDLLTSCLG